MRDVFMTRQATTPTPARRICISQFPVGFSTWSITSHSTCSFAGFSSRPICFSASATAGLRSSSLPPFGPAEGAVGGGKASRPDEVCFKAEAGAQAQNRPGILRDVGLTKGDAHRGGSGLARRLRQPCACAGWHTCAPAVRVPINRRRIASLLVSPRLEANAAVRRRTCSFRLPSREFAERVGGSQRG